MQTCIFVKFTTAQNFAFKIVYSDARVSSIYESFQYLLRHRVAYCSLAMPPSTWAVTKDVVGVAC